MRKTVQYFNGLILEWVIPMLIVCLVSVPFYEGYAKIRPVASSFFIKLKNFNQLGVLVESFDPEFLLKALSCTEVDDIEMILPGEIKFEIYGCEARLIKRNDHLSIVIHTGIKSEDKTILNHLNGNYLYLHAFEDKFGKILAQYDLSIESGVTEEHFVDFLKYSFTITQSIILQYNLGKIFKPSKKSKNFPHSGLII